MTNKILFAWIGNTDLKASSGDEEAGLGPIAQTVSKIAFNRLVLISDHSEGKSRKYSEWLSKFSGAEIEISDTHLSSPTNYEEIYETARDVLDEIRKNFPDSEWTFHLSPGTPAMAAIWLLLAKTIYKADLIESSKEGGVRKVTVPFDISAEFLPSISSKYSDEILNITKGLPPESADFSNIICRCEPMKRLIAKARKIAVFDVPVLIQGESGTGKELFARALHSSSGRCNKPFVPVNCGAIPDNLFESEFFGYKKGAFTGAAGDKDGYFQSANNGTLFLDEIGELSLISQVKLLRVLQEGKVTKVGSTSLEKIDVRIIAATNRDLVKSVSSGGFRTDLFQRLALGVLNIPPLRERKGDINLLVDSIMQEINQSFKGNPHWKSKKLSPEARNALSAYKWPGNVRELKNTLSRAALWSYGETIHQDVIRESIFEFLDNPSSPNEILNRNIDDGINLSDIIGEVSSHYIRRALKQANGNKSRASELIGFANYQTMLNWMKKYGIENE